MGAIGLPLDTVKVTEMTADIGRTSYDHDVFGPFSDFFPF